MRAFASHRSGSYITSFAVIAPILLGLGGGVVDILLYTRHQQELQDVADAAALAAVSEASLKGWSQSTAEAVVDAYVEAHLARPGAASYEATATVDLKTRRIDVSLEQDNFAYFVAGYFKSSPQIEVRAAAQASGETNVCVVGLDASASATVSLDSNAVMTAANCAVYSNSKSSSGLQSKSDARLTATLACSSGGYSGGLGNVVGELLTDCPPIQDPLAGRAPPPMTGTCSLVKEIKDKTATIDPGLYCGGLFIDGNAVVRMNPGIYIFRDGPLRVDSNVTVNGTGVSLVFTGANAGFSFKSNVEVNIEAPSDGPMAGLLVYQTRDSPVVDFAIHSNKTRNLLGTLYMPNGHFIVDASNKVADQSAYTAIVARTIRLSASPNLVLNTDYGATTVPVPSGLGPSKASSRLVK